MKTEHLVKQAALGEFDGMSKDGSEDIMIKILEQYPDWIPPIVVSALRRVEKNMDLKDSHE